MTEINYELLQSNVVEVTFIKKNGEKRIMNSTLQMALIPEEMRPKQKEVIEKTINSKESHLVKVFDVDAQGWRSFIKDTVQNYKVICPWDLWASNSTTG